MNVTQDDLIQAYRVRDVMDPDSAKVPLDAPLAQVFETFANQDYLAYPVVDRDGNLRGLISFDELKRTLGFRHMHNLVLAFDLMQPVMDKTYAAAPLKDAIDRMQEFQIEYMPVVESPEDDRVVGWLNYRTINRALSTELLRRREKASQPEAPPAQ